MLTGDEWIVWLLLLEDVYDPKKSSSVRCSLPAGREDGVLGRAVPSCEIFRLKLIWIFLFKSEATGGEGQHLLLDPVGSLVLERMKAADCIVKNATHHLRLTKNGSTRSVDCCVYLTDRSIETISVVRDLGLRRMTMAAGGYQPLDALHNLMALNEGICYSDYCRTLSCCQLLAAEENFRGGSSALVSRSAGWKSLANRWTKVGKLVVKGWVERVDANENPRWLPAQKPFFYDLFPLEPATFSFDSVEISPDFHPWSVHIVAAADLAHLTGWSR